MFVFAYLLFSNVAIMAGLLYALMMQSRRSDDEPAGTRTATAPFWRTRRRPEATPGGRRP